MNYMCCCYLPDCVTRLDKPRILAERATVTLNDGMPYYDYIREDRGVTTFDIPSTSSPTSAHLRQAPRASTATPRQFWIPPQYLA